MSNTIFCKNHTLSNLNNIILIKNSISTMENFHPIENVALDFKNTGKKIPSNCFSSGSVTITGIPIRKVMRWRALCLCLLWSPIGWNRDWHHSVISFQTSRSPVVITLVTPIRILEAYFSDIIWYKLCLAQAIIVFSVGVIIYLVTFRIKLRGKISVQQRYDLFVKLPNCLYKLYFKPTVIKLSIYQRHLN